MIDKSVLFGSYKYIYEQNESLGMDMSNHPLLEICKNIREWRCNYPKNLDEFIPETLGDKLLKSGFIELDKENSSEK
jgi:hypothetical protein